MSNKHQILLIGDRQSELESVSSILVANGYAVSCARDARQGLRYTDKVPVDLIISSAREKTGFVGQIELISRSIPVLFLTDEPTDEDAEINDTGENVSESDDHISVHCETELLLKKVSHLITHKWMFDSLQENENRLRTIFDNAALGIALIDLEGRPVKSNQALQKMLGYNGEELEKMSFTEFTHPEDVDRDLTLAYEVFEGKRDHYQIEKRFIKKTGEVIWTNLTASSIRGCTDGKRLFIGMVEDITERRLAEEQLKESEARFRDLFENANDLIYIHDLDGNYISINQTAERLFGYSREEIRSMNIEQIVVPEHLQQIRRRMSEKMDGEAQNTTYEADCMTKDGRRLTIEINSRVIYKDGAPAAIQGIARDITERKQTQEALRLSEEQYRDLYENANDLIFTMDLEGKFTSLNRAGEIITGYTCEDALNGNIAQIVEPDYLDKAREMTRRKMTGETPGAYELKIIAKNGQSVWLELSTRLITQDGMPAAIQGIGRDITERKKVEAESEAISSIIKGVTTTSDMDELLELVHQSIKKVLYAENCYVALHDKKTDLLHIPFLRDQFDTAASPQKLGRGLTAYILRKGRPMLMSPEVIGRLVAEGEIELIGTPPALWLGVPLRTPTDVIGVLVVQHYEDKNAYSERDLELLASVGDQIALAIERKRAEEALRENEAKFRDLFDNAPVAYHELDTEGRFTRVNHTEELLLGYTESELKGLRPAEIILEKDAFEATALKLSGHQPTHSIERTFIRKDGSHVSVLNEDRLIYDTEGNITGIRSTLQDITRRKLNEEQLRISGMKLAEANERAIREYDHLLKRLTTLAQSTGAARDLATIFSAILDFAYASVPCAALFISLYDQEQSSRRVIYMWYNGKEVNVSDLDPVHVGTGMVGQALATGEAVILNDYQNVVTKKPTTVYLGYDEDPREPRSTIIAPMKIMGNAIGVIEIQSYELGAYSQEHATAMRMAANLAANAIENVRLLEQERKAAEQLREAQKLESVGRLAGGIAHDFNNMLTAINGYSDLTLKQLPEEDPLRQNLTEIKKAGERSAELTQQLLAFSRRQMLKPKILDINKEVTEIGTLLQRLIGEDVHLVTDLAPALGRVEADPGQLSQVIVNLAVNARDSMPQGGDLMIATGNVQLDADFVARNIGAQPGAYVRISVTDTGIGMNDDIQQHIFEPFFTTKDVGKGTGLGLATVHGIVNQSGGYIRVESQVGKGTTFEVYLPRIAEETQSSKGSEIFETASDGTETILLVEDEEMVRNLSRDILTSCGYSVIEACDGAEALALCEQPAMKFDLLVTDVVMPRMSGRQLAEELSTLRPATKVLYMSGYTDDAVIRKGVIGIDKNFIQKPFTFDAFIKKVRETLDANN